MASEAPPSDALEEFRREWLHELQHVDRRVRDEETPEQSRLRLASELYNAGVHYEREGQITLAMQSYREAFHLNPELSEHGLASASASTALAAPPAGPSGAPLEPSGDLRNADATELDAAASLVVAIPHYLMPSSHLHHTLVAAGALPPLESADASAAAAATNLAALPAELLLAVLRRCDVVSVERAGRTCKLLYVLSRDFSVWQPRCLATLSATFCASVLAQCEGNWRLLYMLAPRVRDDGLYVCKQSYFRRGSKRCRAGSMYDPMYEVVYWRYLRFYLDGTLVAASSAEHPSSARMWVRVGAKHVRTGTFTQRLGTVTGLVNDTNTIFRYELSLSKPRFTRVRGETAPKLTLGHYSALNTRSKAVSEFAAFVGLEFTFVTFERLAKLKPPPPTVDE